MLENKLHKYCRYPILKGLAENDCLTKKELIEEYIKPFYRENYGATDEDFQSTYKNGVNILKVICAWEIVFLKEKMANFITRDSDKKHSLTKYGKEFWDKWDKSKIDVERKEVVGFVETKPEIWAITILNKDNNKKKDIIEDTSDENLDVEVDVEVDVDVDIDLAYEKQKQELSEDILNSFKEMNPSLFEKKIGTLFEKMGYGSYIHTGKTGDKGIDLIVEKDDLGIDKFLVQVKRYTDNTITDKDIMAFIGSIKHHNFSQGVFVTTSNFSSAATKTANQNNVVTIDGDKLVELCIKYKVGVNIKRTYDILEIDQYFFDSED